MEQNEPVGVDEIEQLRETNKALESRQDQMLDALADMHNKLEELSHAQQVSAAVVAAGAPPSITDPRTEIQKALDAEFEDLRDEFKDFEGFSLIERNIKSGGMEDASGGLRLREDPEDVGGPDDPRRYWKVRWANLGAGRDNRAGELSALGYVKVRREELADQDMVPRQDVVTDPYVRRGDRGNEVLYKTPMKLYLYKQRYRQEQKKGNMRSESWTRDLLANGVAKLARESGLNADQAGTAVSNPREFMVSVKPTETETFVA